MPKNPEREGSPRLMTVNEIAEEHGVSRQSVHAYRRRGVFPKAVEGEGSTRPRFREDEVQAFFVANPKRPGRRTDRETPEEGEPVNAREQIVRFVISNLSNLDAPPVDPETGSAIDDPAAHLDELLDDFSRQVASDYSPDL